MIKDFRIAGTNLNDVIFKINLKKYFNNNLRKFKKEYSKIF